MEHRHCLLPLYMQSVVKHFCLHVDCSREEAEIQTLAGAQALLTALPPKSFLDWSLILLLINMYAFLLFL